MKVADHLKSEKTIFSFELLPPLKGTDIEMINKTIDSLMEFDPKYINITSHRDEVVYRKLDNGLLQETRTRKRPGTVAIAAAIQHKYNVDVVPHIICGGFTKAETEYALIDLDFLGIDNLLVLRGDGTKSDRYFVPTEGGNAHTTELIEQVNNFNKGIYLDSSDNKISNFSYGVAGYPEKHAEAPNMTSDMEFLKKKVDMGAEYIVTQMFFDNEKYYEFVKNCKEAGINVPIVPGIKPINVLNQLNVIPQIFHVDLPEDLAKELAKCKDNKDAREVGTEWCLYQARDLMKNNVPSIHFYTMGAGKSVKRIAKEIY